MVRDSDRSRESHISRDRDQIRSWAKEHDVRPVRHRDEAEQYRLLEDAQVTESHERVDWDDFHNHLDESDNVVIYHGEESSEPFEVIHRDDAITRTDAERDDIENRLVEGETVTSTITETSTIERVVVEEATIESELVDTELVDDRVVDAELLRRECTSCTLTGKGDVSDRDWFDEDHYISTGGQPRRVRSGTTTGVGDTAESTGTTTTAETTGEVDRSEREMLDSDEEYPYYAELEVEEAWKVTREFTERFTVESRVEDVDVAETDTVSDRDIDVDVEGLHQSIAESDILGLGRTSDEVLTDYEVESEFHEDDRIQTHFTRSQTVEEEVVDRRRLHADVTSGERLAFERVDTETVGTEMGEESVTATAATEDVTHDESETVVDDDRETAREGTTVTIGNDEVGKRVVDARGEKIGMVTEVAEGGELMYVDADPGLTDRIRAALDWSHANEDDYPVQAHQIASVTRDEVQLREAEDLDADR